LLYSNTFVKKGNIVKISEKEFKKINYDSECIPVEQLTQTLCSVSLNDTLSSAKLRKVKQELEKVNISDYGR
jgi:hypothetical protein